MDTLNVGQHNMQYIFQTNGNYLTNSIWGNKLKLRSTGWIHRINKGYPLYAVRISTEFTKFDLTVV